MKMLIGGKFTDSSDRRTQDIINPANGEIIDTVPKATKEDVKIAIDTAVAGRSGRPRR